MKMTIANNCKPRVSSKPSTVFVSKWRIAPPIKGEPREIILSKKLFPVGSDWYPWTGSVLTDRK